ncbi:TetR/AcrR family transcriptional regulator [Actinoplanes sp. CA-142083]|uniref:TetR/AcrR family transcriptional regulator n=1 Tax=Actinoplanes sp. CA-142083 TaxID=3239903 RepID=UPI003D948616
MRSESQTMGGLRETKRERNRVLTAEVAWRLFIERGYENVTVADICAAAEIAPRTFHRYFPSKDDVIAEPVRYMTGVVAEHITAAAPETTDEAALRAAIHELGIFVIGHADWLRALRTVIQQSPHLSATHQGVPPEREHELTKLLAARHATSEQDWRLRLLVACSVAAFRIWHDDYLRGTIDDPLNRLDEMMAAVSRPALGD